MTNNPTTPATDSNQVLKLSNREVEVIKLLDLTDKEIAQKLHISIHTVRNHRQNIKRKNGFVTTRTDLSKRFGRVGYKLNQVA